MIQFKDDYAKKGWDNLHPIIQSIAKSMGQWSMTYDNLPIVITDTLSTPSRDKKLKRISASHSEGRAIDIRTRDWSKQKLIDFMQYFSDKFKEYGYLNKEKVRKLMIHKNNPPHLHACIGYDVVEKYKNKYPLWSYPQHKKEVINGMD